MITPGGNRLISGPNHAVSAAYSASTPPSVTISDDNSGAPIRRSRLSSAQSSTTAIAPAASAAAGSAAQIDAPRLFVSHSAISAPAEK